MKGYGLNVDSRLQDRQIFPLANGVLKLRYSKWMIASAVFYIASFAGLASIIVPKSMTDAAIVADIAADASSTVEGGYAAAAALYNLLPQISHGAIVLFLGLAFLYSCYWNSCRKLPAAIVFFLTISPSLLTIISFQKDIFLVPFVLAVQFSVLNFRGHLRIVAAVTFTYILYAALFREYYALILVSYIAVMCFSYMKLYQKIVFLSLLFVVMLSLPPDFYEQLQSSRDRINFRLFFSDEISRRTAFTNLVPPTDLLSFTLNYAYAAFRLNFAFLIDVGLKELFLLVNAIMYIYFSMKAISHRSPKVRHFGALVIAHLAVLHLFEPDNGSYIRHLGSTLPYLSYIIFCVTKTRTFNTAQAEPLGTAA